MLARLIAALILLLAATVASAQTLVEGTHGIFSTRVIAGTTDTTGSTSVARLVGLPAKSGETNCVWVDASGWLKSGACGVGTVTSVGLSMPGLFTVTNSPVTTSGTLTVTFATQTNWTTLAANGSGVVSMQALGKSHLPAAVVYTDQANTYGAFLQTFTTLTASGAATLNGAVTLGDAVGDAITVGGRLSSSLTWTTDNTNDLGASGANRPRDLFLSRNATIGGTLGVTGISTLTGLLNANGGIAVDTSNFTVSGTTGAVSTASTLGVSGLASLNGGIAVDSTAFTVADTTGNTSVGGTLDVTGATTLTGLLNANGGIAVDSTAFTVADATGNVSTSGTLTVVGTSDLRGDVSSTTGTLTLNDAVIVTGNLDTRADLFDSGGNLTLNDAVDISGVTTFSSTAQASGWASRTSGWGLTSTGAGDFRELFSDELRVRTFTTEMTQAVNGSMLWTKSVAELAGEGTVGGAVTCPTAGGATETWWFRDFDNAPNPMRVFQAGDYIALRTLAWADSGADGAGELSVTDCIVSVSAYADGTSGNDGYQSWTVTRPASGGGGAANGAAISLKTQALNFGVTADGFLEATVTDGVNNQNAPYFAVRQWDTTPAAANWTQRLRLGQLRGVTSVDEYGLFAGSGACTPKPCVGGWAATGGKYFRATDQNFDLHGITIKMWDADSVNLLLDPGASSQNPYLAIGNPAPTTFASGEGVWMGSDAGTYKFRVGNPGGNLMAYDSSTDTLSVTGTVTAGAGTIGGFTINTTEGLYAGTGATRVQMKPGAGFWAGADARDSAPFRVTQAGALTATSGAIGGWSLGSTTLTGTNVLLDSGGTIRAGVGGAARIEMVNTPALRWYDTAGTLIGAITSAGVEVTPRSTFGTEGAYRFYSWSAVQDGFYGQWGMYATGGPSGGVPQVLYLHSTSSSTGAEVKIKAANASGGSTLELNQIDARLIGQTGASLGRVGGSVSLWVDGGGVGVATATPGARLHIVGSAVTYAAESGPLMVTAHDSVAKKVSIGYDAAFDVGFVSVIHSGVAWKPLVLQGGGGGVGIATYPTAGYSLDVNGAVFSRGDLRVGTDLYISSNDNNSPASIGMPWMRSNGQHLVINSCSPGGLYLNWDNGGQSTYVGGYLQVGANLTVQGATTVLNGGSSSNWASLNVGGGNSINAAGAIYSYNSICVSNASGACTAGGGVVLGITNTSAAVNVRSTGAISMTSDLIFGGTNTITTTSGGIYINPASTARVYFTDTDVEVQGLMVTNWAASWADLRTVCTTATTAGADSFIYYGPSNSSCNASSIRYKTAVEPAQFDWARILDVTPVTFEYKGTPGVPQFGVIAEAVESLGLEPLVVRDDMGMVNAVNYDKVALYLIPVVREQRDRIATLEQRLAALEVQVAAMQPKSGPDAFYPVYREAPFPDGALTQTCSCTLGIPPVCACQPAPISVTKGLP